MGLLIKIQNSDFSNLGLGSVDWVYNFLQAAQITDPAQQAAVRNLYANLKSAGLWSNIGGICFYPGSTAATQKYIFREDLPVLQFAGTPVFNANGFNPNGAGYAIAPFTPPAGNYTNMSMGVYNGTSEATPAGSNKCVMMGAWDYHAPTDYYYMLSRYYQTGTQSPVASLAQTTAQEFLLNGSLSYDVTKTGLLQFVRQGSGPNSSNLIDNGNVIVTGNLTSTPIGGGYRSMFIGCAMDFGNTGTPTWYSSALQKFAYWGSLTVAQAQQLNGIVSTFLTAFGR
jgi:hypothetical protein